MGSFSDYTENKLLDLALGAQSFTRPATCYAALYTNTLTDAGAGTEVSGGSYVRKAITNNATNFPAASALAKSLAVAQVFVTATGSWGTVTDGGLWDAITSGNLLVEATLGSPQSIGSGDIASLEIGGITSGLSGSISTFLGNKLLDHLLGGADYTPPASWYLALFVSGTEVSGNNYSRVAVTNNLTNFPAASAGAKAMAAQTFPTPSGAWGTVDEVRLMDASSGGNIGFLKSLTTPRSVTGSTTPARFSASALTFSLS